MSEDEIGRYRQTTEPYPAIPLPPPGRLARGFASSSIGPAQPRDRQPLYPLAADEHDAALDSLWQATQELESRLGPALTPPATAGVSGGGQQQPAPSLPLIVERVNTQTKKVRLIESKLRDIADRVEV